VLTPKQQRFVDEYLVDLNGKQAAIRCGYKPSRAERTACELLASRKVSEAVAAGRQLKAFQTGRSVAAVMADIGRVRDDAMQVITDPDTGAQVMLSHKDALKALELEGKHLGAFTEKLQVTGPGGGPIQSVSMTPDEFARIAAEVAGRI
jgi:phage terminase small subunit